MHLDFAIGMDYVNSTYDIPMIEDYLNPNGMFDILSWFGGTSMYVFPPIVFLYCIVTKLIRQISKRIKNYISIYKLIYSTFFSTVLVGLPFFLLAPKLIKTSKKS